VIGEALIGNGRAWGRTSRVNYSTDLLELGNENWQVNIWKLESLNYGWDRRHSASASASASAKWNRSMLIFRI
jgi:hypothetical protein